MQYCYYQLSTICRIFVWLYVLSVCIYCLCMLSVQTANPPLLLLCDHQCSPTWSHRLLNSASTSQVPVACCHTPPATAGVAEGGNLLRASRHTGGLSLCQGEGDWPFEPPDIPKWTETIMWYLTDPHRGIFFSLASQTREVKAQGELYNCTPGAYRNCWRVLVKHILSLPAGWMLKPRFFSSENSRLMHNKELLNILAQ